MTDIITHSSELSLEPFDHGRNGPALSSEAERGPPIDAVAPTGDRAPKGPNRSREAEVSVLGSQRGDLRSRSGERSGERGGGEGRGESCPGGPEE